MPPDPAAPATARTQTWTRDPALLAAFALLTALVGFRLASWAAGSDVPPSTLDRAGPLTQALLPVVRLSAELAALAVVAGLSVSLFTLGRVRDLWVVPALPRSVAGWAGTWAALALAWSLLSASDISNQPVVEVLRTGLVLEYLRIIPQARTQAVAAALALGVALLALMAPRVAGRGRLAVLGLMLAGTGTALAYPLTVGHSASAANHQLAITVLVVHVLAAAAWVGGLAGLVVHLRHDAMRLLPAVSRFQVLALGAFAVVGASGVANAWTRVPDLATLTSTPYGWLLLAKAAALLVLGGFGAWHRRSTIRALADGEAGAFQRLAAVEVLVMTATVGLAVALSSTPTP